MSRRLPRLAPVAFWLLSITIAHWSEAACNPKMLGGFENEGPHNGSNFALVQFDPQHFPDQAIDADGNTVTGIRQKIIDGVGQAQQTWNEACGGSLVHEYPDFVPLFDTAMDAGFVTVIYETNELAPNPSPCSNNRRKLCHAAMITDVKNDGRVEIIVYQESGAEGQLESTLGRDHASLTDMFTHEFGHALGLSHDKCSNSFMKENPRTLDGNGVVHSKQCDLLQATHDPRHPLQDLLQGNGLDPGCVLGGYCGTGGSPWPVLKTVCGWNLRTVTATITISIWNPVIGLIEFVTNIERATTDYLCVPIWTGGFGPAPPTGGGDLPDPPAVVMPEPFDGPTISLALPRPSQPVEGDSLYLRGWISSWDEGIGDVALWIDGIPVEPADLQWGFYSPELCQAGLDVGECDPFSGLSATLDVSQLAPGPHLLEIAAVDGRSEDPFPTYIARQFEVGESSGPVAINDTVNATIDLTVMAGIPIDIPVTANDYDSQGGTVWLTPDGVVVSPTEGVAERLDSHTIRYTPNLDAGPTDTFKYAIRNAADQRARGRVNIQIMYLIWI